MEPKQQDQVWWEMLSLGQVECVSPSETARERSGPLEVSLGPSFLDTLPFVLLPNVLELCNEKTWSLQQKEG